jgi:hypothetical protein
MKRKWLAALIFLVPAAAQQAPLYFSGAIEGSVQGNDGSTIAGALLSLQLQPPYVQSRYLRFEWVATSGPDGSFQFTGLGAGAYKLCGYAPHGAWLNPCAWGLQPPTATLSGAQPTAAIKLTLNKGAVVPIRINDPAQLLPQYEGKSPGSDVLIGVANDARVFMPAQAVSQDTGGENLQVVIPFGSTVNLLVFAPQFQLSSATVPLPAQASTTIPVAVPSGLQPATITLQVTGRVAP